MQISTGAVTTLAGTAGSQGSVDGIGAAARLGWAFGITTDGTNLYVADSGNKTIRKIVISTGAVTTIAGTAGIAGSVDGSGAAARFNYPFGITTDGANLYVLDIISSAPNGITGNTIRKIAISSGAVTTIAGTASAAGSVDGIGAAARFTSLNCVTTCGKNLYVTDKNSIRKIVISTGAVTTIAGTAGTPGSADGIGVLATFNKPQGITTDGTNLYIVDSNNNTIRKLVLSTGAVTTIAGAAGIAGAADGNGSAASFAFPLGITSDGTSLYVTDNNAGGNPTGGVGLVRKIR